MISRFLDFTLTHHCIIIIANFDFSIVNTIARYSVQSVIIPVGIRSMGIQYTRYIVRIPELLAAIPASDLPQLTEKQARLWSRLNRCK